MCRPWGKCVPKNNVKFQIGILRLSRIIAREQLYTPHDGGGDKSIANVQQGFQRGLLPYQGLTHANFAKLTGSGAVVVVVLEHRVRVRRFTEVKFLAPSVSNCSRFMERAAEIGRCRASGSPPQTHQGGLLESTKQHWTWQLQVVGLSPLAPPPPLTHLPSSYESESDS